MSQSAETGGLQTQPDGSLASNTGDRGHVVLALEYQSTNAVTGLEPFTPDAGRGHSIFGAPGESGIAAQMTGRNAGSDDPLQKLMLKSFTHCHPITRSAI